MEKSWNKVAELAGKLAVGESIAFDSQGSLCVAGLRVGSPRFIQYLIKGREQHVGEDAPSGQVLQLLIHSMRGRHVFGRRKLRCLHIAFHDVEVRALIQFQ